EICPDCNEGRGADAAATPPRRHDKSDRRAVVRVDLGVDECYIPAPKRGDQAEALAHDAAAVFARARGDKAEQVLGQVDTAECTARLARTLWWYVIAKRCASSRMRCTRYIPCELRGKTIGSARFGRKSSSRSFASATIGICKRPASASASRPAESCPFPPSRMTRSGSAHADPVVSSACEERAKRRRSVSRMFAKSSLRSCTRARKRRDCDFAGRPSSNTTIEDTTLVPCTWLTS